MEVRVFAPDGTLELVMRNVLRGTHVGADSIEAKFLTMVVDEVGSVWIMQPRSPTGSHTYSILDSTGVLIGTMTLPRMQVPFSFNEPHQRVHIGRDWILYMRSDSLGVEQVVHAPLRRR
jgi:hypothetical protein